MAAKTPTMNVSSDEHAARSSSSRGRPPSSGTSCQAARRQTGVRIARHDDERRARCRRRRGRRRPRTAGSTGAARRAGTARWSRSSNCSAAREPASSRVTQREAEGDRAWRGRPLPGQERRRRRRRRSGTHRSSVSQGQVVITGSPTEHRGWRRHRRASSGRTTGHSRSGGDAASRTSRRRARPRPPTAPSTPRASAKTSAAGEVDAGPHEQALVDVVLVEVRRAARVISEPAGATSGTDVAP